MRTATYEEFLNFAPGWLDEEGGAERIKAYFDKFGGSVSALDILNLDDISAQDKLWAVLRKEFIPASILHEFGCVCAEYALTLIDNPDPHSIKVIEIKRAWLRGEATDEELDTARTGACAAADAARYAARHAAWAAWAAASDSAWVAAWVAARDAIRATARDATRDATARKPARAATREAQVAYLIMTLEGEGK